MRQIRRVAAVEGTVQIDHTAGFYLALPACSDFSRADLVTDRKNELEKVEK